MAKLLRSLLVLLRFVVIVLLASVLPRLFGLFFSVFNLCYLRDFKLNKYKNRKLNLAKTKMPDITKTVIQLN